MERDTTLIRTFQVPLATLALPIRLRNGLHGTWLSAEQLAGYTRPERGL